MRCDNCQTVLYRDNSAIPVWAGPPYICDDCFEAAENGIPEVYTTDNGDQ